MGNGDDGPAELELLGERAEVVDARLQPARRAGPLGETHVELVDGDHPNTGLGAGDHVSPEVRPSGVAVNAQQRDNGVGHTVVEHVPGPPDSVEVRPVEAQPVEVGCDDQSRPPRVEPREVPRGQRCFELDFLPRHAGIVRVTVSGVDSHLEYAYDAAPDIVFAMFGDPEFLRAKLEATDALEYEVVECEATPDGGFRIVTKRTVKADIPGFAKKFFKANTSMTQTEDWEAASDGVRAGTWRIEPHGVPVSVSTSGTTRLEAAGEGAVQFITATIKVGVPLIGGKLERFVYDQAKSTMDLEHAFGQQWLEKQK